MIQQTSERDKYQKPLILFLHLPKTGGSTLRGVLRRQFPLNSVLDMPTINSSIDREGIGIYLDILNSMPEDKRNNIQCLIGHMYFGIHEFLDQPIIYFTILRDPVERVVSLYHYLRRSASDITYRKKLDDSRFKYQVENMTLEEFVSSGMTLEVNNGQTRRLAGFEEESHVTSFGEDSLEMLDKAKNNLCNSISTFGIMDDFDKTLLLLKRFFGWDNVFYFKSNVTKKKSTKSILSKEAIDIIIKYNKLDIELYQHAKFLFKERLSQENPAFEREAAMFNIINPLYGRFHAATAAATNRIKRSFFT